jgi:Protein of unknown function (DUF4038)/Domain of unknown function (DUF5060)/Putative collagen-binding domain of a collagenase
MHSTKSGTLLMNRLQISRSHRLSKWFVLACVLTASLAHPHEVSADFFSHPQSYVAKWGRFEQEFRSATNYPNPLEDAALTTTFSSPLGETFKVNGFWDGGKVWRVRFSPNFPGNWRFHTVCSDAANHGLNNIDGQFVCTAASGESAFDRHGPLHVARDNRHFEHDDHTTFFWLADTADEGAIRSTPQDWEYYAQVRTRQHFSAIRWIALPENSANGQPVYFNGSHLQVNFEQFRNLDAKAEKLNSAGLLNAIIPFTKATVVGTNLLDALPDDEVIALLRYMTARWDANDVAWLLPCDDARPGRWKRIGRAVFGEITHSPVVVNCGEAYWMLDELRGEPWVDALGYQCSQETNEDAVQWMVSGPMTRAWNKEPTKPIINLSLPCENQSTDLSHGGVTAELSRRAAYWSMLGAPLAGITCVASRVSNWDATIDSRKTSASQTWQAWQIALFSPGATNMGILADAFSSIDFWRLRPAPELLAKQTGSGSPFDHVAAARSEEGDLCAIYVPQNEPVELNTKFLPGKPTAIWIDLRTGRRSNASFSPTSPTERLLPPAGSADWLLIIKGVAK